MADAPSEVILCARYGELEDLQALLEQGESPDVTDSHGNTALHMAAANGHTEIVEFLLTRMRQGAVNAVNEGGNTPLHWAALNGHTAVVQKLLDFGAHPVLKNKADRTPLDEAADRGHNATAEAIVQCPRFKEAMDAEPEPPAPSGAANGAVIADDADADADAGDA